MISQDVVNIILGILLGLVSFFGSWWMKATASSIKELQGSDQSLVKKVSEVEILVVGNYAKKSDVDRVGEIIMKRLDKLENLEVVLASHYVTKEEFHKSIDTLFAKLDRIEEKLDKKADKS